MWKFDDLKISRKLVKIKEKLISNEYLEDKKNKISVYYRYRWLPSTLLCLRENISKVEFSQVSDANP